MQVCPAVLEHISAGSIVEQQIRGSRHSDNRSCPFRTRVAPAVDMFNRCHPTNRALEQRPSPYHITLHRVCLK